MEVVLPNRFPTIDRSLLRKFVGGGAWSVLGTTCSRGGVVAGNIIAARLLGRERFGEFAIIQSTIAMLVVVAGAGVGSTAAKYVAELRYTDPARAGRILGMAFVFTCAVGSTMALGLLVAAPTLVATYGLGPSGVVAFRIGALMLLASSMTGAQLGVLLGCHAFKSVAAVSAVGGLVTFAGLVVGTFYGGTLGGVAGITTGAVATCLAAQFAVRNENRSSGGVYIQFSGWRTEWPLLLKFSLPSALSAYLVGPVTWLSNSILAVQPGGLASLGLFNAANQWRLLVLFVPSSVSSIMLPLLASATTRRGFQQTFAMNLIGTALVCIIPASIIIVWRAPLMEMFGDQYTAATSLVPLVVIAGVVSALNAPIGQAMAAMAKTWQAFGLNAVWAAAFILLTVFLVPKSGAAGLAQAYLLSYIVHTCSQGVYVIFIRSR